MREIKVRGFDKTLQQWVVGYLCSDYNTVIKKEKEMRWLSSYKKKLK